MCLLNIKRIEPKGEITCYKILLKYVWKCGESYNSPCQRNHSWNFGYTYTVPSWELLGERMPHIYRYVNEEGNYQFIAGGAFHTIKNLEDAKKFLSMVREKYPMKDKGPIKGYVLAKCTIPKDSSFVFEGVTNIEGEYKPESYASEKLCVDEIIDP